MWNNLTETQKIKYKEYCDKKFGKTITFCENNEPMYFDENCNLIDTKIIIDLLFNISKN